MSSKPVSSSKKKKNVVFRVIIKSITYWLNSFNNNNNTGVNEEKKTGIELLLRSGLDTYENVPDEYKDIRSEPPIHGILGIINLTQSDNIGGTADIGIKYDNRIDYFSVTQWKGKNAKCMCNPSATKWYNVPKTPELEQINDKAYNLACEYRKTHKGEIPNKKWKRRGECPGAKLMATELAEVASTQWNNMDIEDKKKSLTHFLDINSKLKTNATGIIYWDNKTNCIKHVYNWKLNINIEDYLDSYNDGIYIYHGTPDNYILKTQAKYTNGIIEGMSSKQEPEQWILKKSTKYLTSWNTVVPDLTKIFEIKCICLDK
jgi:hypothetical protein